MAGLETIYLTKIPKVKPPLNMSQMGTQNQQKMRNFSAQR